MRKPSDARHWLWLSVCVVLALRVVYAWALRVNSDEPQHLHIVWAWTHGLLPYRDVFDNHTPLFQLLSAPLFAVIGERAQILPLMRIATIPWYALALWCTYRIGRALFDARTGVWAALITAVWPAFFILSAQFRTDIAWAPLWLATLVVAIEGKPTPRRAFFVGFLAGAACAVSLKSTLLLATLALASLFVIGLQRMLGHRVPVREIVNTTGTTLLGFAILPAVISIAFWSAGAWDQFIYCVFQHNVIPELGNWEHGTWRFALFPLAIPALLLVAREMMRHDDDRDRGAKRAFVFLSATLYFTALTSYWPLMTRQDLLPFIPFAMIFLVALLRAYPATPGWRSQLPLRCSLPLLVELAFLFSFRPPWKDRVHRYVQELSDLQHLTEPGDFVMDAKGEAIFRPRPIYFALEQITLTRMDRGLIKNDIVASLIATKTAVVVAGNDLERMPPDVRAFVQQNYIKVRRRILVAGKKLSESKAGQLQHVDIALPGRYAMTTDTGAFVGSLDGTPYTGSRELLAGEHEIVALGDSGNIEMVWAQALERGFTPSVVTQRDNDRWLGRHEGR